MTNCATLDCQKHEGGKCKAKGGPTLNDKATCMTYTHIPYFERGKGK